MKETNQQVDNMIQLLRIAKSVSDQRYLKSKSKEDMYISRHLDKFANDMEKVKYHQGEVMPLIYLRKPTITFKVKALFAKKFGYSRRLARAYVDNIAKGVLRLDEDGKAPEGIYQELVAKIQKMSEMVYASKLSKGYYIRFVVRRG